MISIHSRDLVSDDIQDRSNNRSQQRIFPVAVRTILCTSVVTVLVSSFEALTEIVTIFVHRDVVVIVTVGGILVAIRILVIAAPVVVPVSLSGLQTRFVTIIQGVTEHLRTILAGVVILAAAIVSVVVVQVIVEDGILQPDLVSANTIPILILIAQITAAILLLQVPVSLLLSVLPVVPT